MPGRPRKPTNQKILQGTFRQDRAINEPQPDAPSEIEPPKELRTKRARELYVKYASQLMPSGLFTVADGASLATLVRVEILIDRLERKIQLDLLSGSADNPIADPRLPAYRDLLKHAADLRRGFGMDPASRSKIDLPAPGEDDGDGMADILAGNG
mgnify:CR=1 FL=1